MSNPLLDMSTEIVTALAAAGLDARTAPDPDRGPCVVVSLPELAWPFPHTGCGPVNQAETTVELVVIGGGYAPEHVETLMADAWTAATSCPPAWRVEELRSDESGNAPLYRITIRK